MFVKGRTFTPLLVSALLVTLVAPFAALGEASGPPLETRAAETLQRLSQSLVTLQQPQGAWQGAIEADPTADVMPLILASRLGLKHDQLIEESTQRIFNRQDPETGLWGAYPGGPPSLDVTGMILVGLQFVGIERDDARVSKAWDWFQSKGGTKALGALNKMISVMGGILPPESVPALSPKFFALPKKFPLNVFNLGFGRSGIVPLAVWRYYREAREGYYPTPKRLDPKRIASKGSAFGHMSRAPLELRDLADRIHRRQVLQPADIVTGKPSELTKIMDYVQRAIPTSADFWAQEGLGWILDHQQVDGTWAGALQITYFCMLTLHEAQLAGVGNFEQQIEAAWQGLMGWRTSIPEGSIIQQSTVGPVMDTARILTAFGKDTALLPVENADRAIRWLLDHQLSKKGDWTGLAKSVSPGAWTFENWNDFYPDSDDTGMVIEALAQADPVRFSDASTAIDRGLNWLVGMQNRDGGFPTWDRGTSSLFRWIADHHVAGIPEVYDQSQADITSRVLKGLAAARDLAPSSARAERLRKPILRACSFLLAHRQTIADAPLPVWRGEWMVNYLYGTAQAVEALLVSGCFKPQDAAPYISWILAKQATDGGWGESPEGYPTKNYVSATSTLTQTEFVLAPLIRYQMLREKTKAFDQPNARPAIERGVDALVKRIGTQEFPYETEFTGVYVRGVWYGRYVILPHYEAVRVLKEYLSL